jgi:hypothetical protein
MKISDEAYLQVGTQRARRSRVPFYEFLPPEGKTEISVDRLSVAPPDQATSIADSRDNARGRTFYGWAIVTEEKSVGNGRRVVASPIPCQNPYHADIVLPADTANNREKQKLHAQELADSSYWRDRSDRFL